MLFRSKLQEEVAELAKKQKEEGHKPPTPLTDAQLREALTKMHHGLVIMQDRLDDHEKVIEKLITGMTNIAETMAPQKGFRQASSKKVN